MIHRRVSRMRGALVQCVFATVLLQATWVRAAETPSEGPENPGWRMAAPPQVEPGTLINTFTNTDPLITGLTIATNGADAITPEIVELARGLDANPVRLYEYVYNHILYEPYYGAKKGATRTFLDRAGNDCDQAALLVALLRQSGYEARYVYGNLTIPYQVTGDAPGLCNWVGTAYYWDALDALVSGGVPATNTAGGTAVSLDYMCVEVNVSNAWYRLAPSLKTYGQSTAQDITAMMGYDRAQLLAAAGGTASNDYAQSLDETAVRQKLDTLSSNLLASLSANMPNASVGDVIGERWICRQSLAALPTNLPCAFTADRTFTAVPTNMEHRVKIQYGGITQTLAFHDIAHRKLTLSYDQLTLGATNGPMVLGGDEEQTTNDLPVVIEALSDPGDTNLIEVLSDDFGTNVVIAVPENFIDPGTNEVLATYTWNFGTNTQAGSSSGTVPYSDVGVPNHWSRTITVALSSNPQGAFSITQGAGTTVLQENQSMTIRVLFSGAGQARGVKTGTLSVSWYYNNTPGLGAGSDTFNLTGRILESPNLGATGMSVARYMNESVAGTCSIINNGTQPLTIQSISLANNQNNQFSITGGSQSGTVNGNGARRDVTIQYAASTHGISTVDLVLDMAYDSVDYSPLTITHIAQGQAYYKPNLTITTAPNFGAAWYQEPKEGDLVIRNSGSYAIHMNPGSLVGTDASRFAIASGGGQADVSPNSTYTTRIRYKSDQVGVHTNLAYRLIYTCDTLTYTNDVLLAGGQTLSRPHASLLLDRGTLAAESGSISGAVAACTLIITHPYSNCNQTVTYNFKRGALYAIMCGSGDAESGFSLARRQRELESLRLYSTNDASPEVLTQSLHVMGQTWLDESALSGRAIERLYGLNRLWHHRFGVMAQESGYYVDVKAQVASFYSTDWGGASTYTAMKGGSLLASSFEHAILEQLQGTNRSGVSTVKLLQMANQNGDRIYRLTSGNSATVLAALTNYAAADLAQIQAGVANNWTQILPRNGAMTAGTWVGNGYVTFGNTANSGYQVAMIISGDYHGGYCTQPGSVNSWTAVSSFLPGVSQNAAVNHASSADPVDLVTGTFLHQSEDLALGDTDPVGLHFVRSYNGLDASRTGPLGYGWTHSYDVRLTEHSAWQGGLGLRTPADAVPLLVSATVLGDLVPNVDTPKGWVTAALVSKWATDQVTANAVTVYLGNRALTFAHLPDGRYNPPPGVTMSLFKTNGLYTLAERNGREYRFNAQLRLASIVDPDANTLSLTYNAQTNLTGVADACSRTLAFTYAAGNRLTNVVDSTGRKISFGFDASSNLTAFTDAGGNAWAYRYDTNHWMTATVEPGGVTNAANSYDSFGRVKQQVNGRGLVSQLLFADFRSVEQDPAGNRRVYYYDDQQRETGRELVPGAPSVAMYDGQNHMVAAVDPLGRNSLAFYDGRHNVTSTVNALNQTNVFVYDGQNRLVSAIDPMGHTTATEYNTKHHPTRVTDPLGNTVDNVYLANGLPWRKIETPSAPAGGGSVRTTDSAFSTWRTPTNVLYPDGTHATFAYNAVGQLTAATDARGNTTTYAYDNRGLRLRESDALGNVASNTYNSLGLLASAKDKRGQITTYTYSATRAPLTVTAPDGGAVSNTYDNADRVSTVRNPRGGVTSNTWDSAGRKIAERDPNGVTVGWAYDNVGNILTMADGLGNVSTNVYDALNRLIEARTPLGSATHTEFDAAGRIVASVDALGRRTAFSLDALGRKLAVTRADAKIERFLYDGYGNLLAFTNAAGNAQRFSYDLMARKTGESNAVGAARSFAYDATGNLASKTDGNGRTNQFGYDTLNRPNRVQYANGDVVTFTNDPAGNLTGMGDSWGTGASAGAYEAVGRRISWTDHHGLIVQYRYDKAGAITNIVYPGNLVLAYVWDSAGRLASVKDWTGREWTFGYDGANRLNGIQYPNGVTCSRGFNADGQLTSYVYSKSGTAFIQRGLTRNLLGIKTSETISAGLEAAPPATWQNMSSDAADRLTGVNRRDEQVLPERWHTVTPTYDGDGRTVAQVEIYRGYGATNALAWNDAGRLTNFVGVLSTNLWMGTPPTPTQVANVFDGLGERTVRVSGGQPRRFLVDRVGRRGVPLVEADGANSPVRYFIWAPGVGLLAQIEADGTIRYVHADETGSTLSLTDAGGNVTDQFCYALWGEIIGRTGTNAIAFTFVGGHGVYWEGGSLYRMKARFYDAHVQRWLSPDPAGISGGANLYAYCMGNPLAFLDFMGLCAEPQLYWQQSQSVSQSSYPNAEIRAPSNVDPQRVTDLNYGRGYDSSSPFSGLEVQQANITGQFIGNAVMAAVTPYAVSRVAGWFGGAESAVQEGTTVYRVWGGKSGPWGESWTSVNPNNVPNLRSAAGLPDVNTGRFVSEGVLQTTEGVSSRGALIIKQGQQGNLPELVIKNAEQRIKLQNVSGANPEF